MTQRGTIHGNRIEPDSAVDLPAGTRVEVAITPEPGIRKGSPEAILRLAGTLTDSEADAISTTVNQSRVVDPELWRNGWFTCHRSLNISY